MHGSIGQTQAHFVAPAKQTSTTPCKEGRGGVHVHILGLSAHAQPLLAVAVALADAVEVLPLPP